MRAIVERLNISFVYPFVKRCKVAANDGVKQELRPGYPAPGDICNFGASALPESAVNPDTIVSCALP